MTYTYRGRAGSTGHANAQTVVMARRVIEEGALVRESIIGLLERLRSWQVQTVIEAHVVEGKRATCPACGALHLAAIPCDVCPILLAVSARNSAR